MLFRVASARFAALPFKLPFVPNNYGLDLKILDKTDDGDLIYFTYSDQCSKEQSDRLNGGELLKADDCYFITVPTFQTKSEKYAWLNAVEAVGKMVSVKAGRGKFCTLQHIRGEVTELEARTSEPLFLHGLRLPAKATQGQMSIFAVQRHRDAALDVWSGGHERLRQQSSLLPNVRLAMRSGPASQSRAAWPTVRAPAVAGRVGRRFSVLDSVYGAVLAVAPWMTIDLDYPGIGLIWVSNLAVSETLAIMK